MQTSDARPVTADSVTSARVSRWLGEQERSKSWLARKLNVTDSTIGRRIAGGGWTLDELDRLAEVLGLTPSELVDTTDTSDLLGRAS